MKSLLQTLRRGSPPPADDPLQDEATWPVVEFDEGNQPHFLFVVTPPRSGSTALSEVLNSSHRTMVLQRRGEGQWLIPGLRARDRWDPDKAVNYASVKSIWLSTFQMVQELTKHTDVVIEKSPPNMMRLEALVSQFSDYSLLATNRDPYANCASTIYREYAYEAMEEDERRVAARQCAEAWVAQSATVKDLVTKLEIPFLSYESFCEDPSALLPKLRLPDGVTDSIDLDVKVQVKDYQAQGISNQNARQIAKITDAEIASISEVLETRPDVLEFFGYRLLA